jgi:FKBP-type peptidyl-prolyl cis-trans isomerase
MLASCEEDKYADWKILNKQWIENYFEKHENDAGFHRTESGLCYKVIHQGETLKQLRNVLSVTQVKRL